MNPIVPDAGSGVPLRPRLRRMARVTAESGVHCEPSGAMPWIMRWRVEYSRSSPISFMVSAKPSGETAFDSALKRF